MKKVYHVCTKEVTYNGKKYYPGYPWLPEDGGDPPPVGTDWVIRQDDEAEGPQDGIAVSASRGFVRWKEQPARPRVQPLTPEEKQQLESDPYGSLEETAAEPPPVARDPLAREKRQTPVAPFLQTQAEIEDPYGLKARTAATTENKESEW